MKLIESTSTLEQTGLSGASQFTMKSSRKAFQILSDLYSDKPLAIIRELGCNASDAMVAAGKYGQPFHIHLPNTLEPWLTIQDYGTGISPENIYSIYSTYFESTKTNTNDQIGCLGLGSKSPFCYTDNFSVTSIYDGEKRTYNAYFNEQNTPTIALMGVTPTNEGNGIAIQIPVKPQDFQKFKDSVRDAFRFFDVKPIITGDSLVWRENNPMFSGDDWMFFDNQSSHEAYAIMGGVTYPIENRHLLDKYNLIVRKGIVLKFNIGELDFAPSREHLSYDEATIKALNDKLEKVMTELKDKVKDMIQNKDNLLESLRAVQYFNDRFSYYGNSAFELKGVKYKGLDITEPYQVVKTIHPEVQSFQRYSYRRSVSMGTTYNIESKWEWFVNDNSVNNPINRVKSYVRDNDKFVLLISLEGMEKFIAAGFPADNFKMVSTLPSPFVQRKVKNGVTTQKVKEDITIYYIGDNYKVTWDSHIIEPTATAIPKFYVIKGKTWDLDIKLNGLLKITDKDRLRRYLDAFGIYKNDVVLVSSREADKLDKRGCKSLVKHFNKIDFSWIDPVEIATIKEYGNHDKDIIKMQDFVDLGSENPIANKIVKINHLRNKYKKFQGIICYLDTYSDKTLADKMTDPANEIVVKNLLSSWSEEDKKEWITIAKALHKNS
jgi:hypothetical protein